jgi:hypothetical protein
MIVILYDAKAINPEVSNAQHAGKDNSIEKCFWKLALKDASFPNQKSILGRFEQAMSPAMAQTNVAAFFIPCLVKPDRTRTTGRSQIENTSVKIIAPACRATFAILSLLHKGSSDGNCFWGTCVAQDLRYVCYQRRMIFCLLPDS